MRVNPGQNTVNKVPVHNLTFKYRGGAKKRDGVLPTVCVGCFKVLECVCVCVSGVAESGCTRAHGFLTSLCVCLSQDLAAAYFLLGSTAKSTGSLSSLQRHFAQPQTLLAVFRGKGRVRQRER